MPVYEHAFEILQDYNTNNDVGVRLPGLDCRRYEVAVILPGKNYTEPRDITLRHRNGPLVVSKVTRRHHDVLLVPILYLPTSSSHDYP